MSSGMPLSPRSPSVLNRQSMSPVKDSKSPSAAAAVFVSGGEPRKVSAQSNSSMGSSPFQTEVSVNITPNSPLTQHESFPIVEKENLSPLEDTMSSSKFKIYSDEDDEIDKIITTTPEFPKHDLKSLPRPDHDVKLSPRKSSRSPSKSRFRKEGATTTNAFNSKPPGDDTLSSMREEIFQTQLHQSTNFAKNRELEPKSVGHETNEDDADVRSVASEDTCFSTFSAVPNTDMTLFANINPPQTEDQVGSPQRITNAAQTPGHAAFYTPNTSRRTHHRSNSRSKSPSPTPRQVSRDGDTTSLLLDFTQQFQQSARSSPTKRGLSPTKTEPNLLTHLNNQRMPSPVKGTPAGRRSILNLLDFDLPPQPTPRSVPSITIRELESLKSSHLSDISSLKATLSGKEAEVESLKKAVADAERRVGEALENLREERGAKEHAEKEKAEWEKKGQEVECVLRNVREEFEYVEKEKEELLQKLEESNRLREEAELNAAAAAATKASLTQDDGSESTGTQSSPEAGIERIVEQRVAQQLDEKMENLARELHAVYKKKHETKVATLKKTYEARSEKKCRDLQQKIDDLSKQNDDLQASKDASFSDEIPTNITTTTPTSEQLQQMEATKTELEEYKAKLAGLTEEVKTVKSSHAQLLQDLEAERVEKGELVAAVDEMLALQADVGTPNASVVEDFRKSISRPQSGLKGPGFGSSAGSTLSKPAASGKSKMMMGIERMGSARST